MKFMASIIVGMFLLAGLSACQKEEGPAEKAGKEIDKAIGEVGKKMEEAGDKVKEATEQK